MTCSLQAPYKLRLMALTDDIVKILQPPESGIVLVVTVGNVFRADDSVGPYIAKHVRSPKKGVHIVDAGERPEMVFDHAAVLKPARTVIIDTAEFGGLPGEARVIAEEFIPESILSTHTFPLRAIAKILAEDTSADVYFIGIQAVSVAYGEQMSPMVKQTADSIIALLSGD